MAVVTRKRSTDFAVIPNAVAADKALSFDARGLLVYLLSKPNDWKVLIKNIQSEGGIGRDKAYRLLSELIGAGYIEKQEVRGPGARFTDVTYIVHDCVLPKAVNVDRKAMAEIVEPMADNTVSWFSGSGKADSGKSGHNTKKGRIQRTESPLPPGKRDDELWDEIVGMWPKKHLPRSLRAAKVAFLKLSVIEQEEAHETCRYFLLRKFGQKEKPLLIPYLKTKGWQEFRNEPPKGSDGYFIIENFRPEWEVWLEHILVTRGEDAVAKQKRRGKILAKRRWPT